MEQCFICADSTPPLYKVCKCNMSIHSTCLTRMVNRVSAHQTECHVCKTKYAYHLRRTGYKLVCHCNLLRSSAYGYIVLLASIVLGTFAALFVNYVHSPFMSSLLSVASALFFIMYLFDVWRNYSHRWFRIHIEPVTTRVLQLPTPL